MTRWRLKFQEFEFDIVHRPVIVLEEADALPCRETKGSYTSKLEEDIPVLRLEERTKTQ